LLFAGALRSVEIRKSDKYEEELVFYSLCRYMLKSKTLRQSLKIACFANKNLKISKG